MERKIGEIFEYNGEWYQCIERLSWGVHCNGCDFIGRICSKLNPKCSPTHNRSDGKSVIFKKLEKVGEPYNNNGKLVQNYKLYIPVYGINEDEINSIIPIEIKQNKEDMEEKKLNLKPFDLEAAKQGHPVCCRNGRKARIICFDANVEKGKPIVALLYDGKDREFVRHYTEEGKDCESCSFNDLRMCYESEESKSLSQHESIKEVKFKPFNIKAAKEGKPVCTRDGRKARIICFDRLCCDEISTIVACVQSKDGKDENVIIYNSDGFIVDLQHPHDEDLMMALEKKEGWVNIYRGQVYNTFEKAKEARKIAEHNGNNCLKTIKIEWEE